MEDADAATLAKALGHPIRLAILRELRSRSSTELSPLGFTGKFGFGSPQGVCCHFKALRDAEVLSVARREPRRGSAATYHALRGKQASAAVQLAEAPEEA
jgi:DNA-binding transcriptional ArsR family regulator